METQGSPTSNGKSKTTKYVLIGVGAAGTLAIAGYFVYQHFKQKNIAANEGEDDLDATLNNKVGKYSLPQQPASNSTNSNQLQNDSTFPLKKGSHGALVKDIQDSLIKAYGASVLPKYGADKQWGSELTKALTDHGFATTIDLAEYTKIKAASNSSGTTTNFITKPITTVVALFNASTVAASLYASITAKAFTTTVGLLQKMQSPADYKSVGDIFKQIPWKDFKRYTLLTATFDAFSDANQKTQLTTVFKNMGLKLDPGTSKWSNPLGAINANIETLKSTMIWDGSGIEIEIPSGTLLGEELSRDQNIVRFHTADGWNMYVLAEDVIQK